MKKLQSLVLSLLALTLMVMPVGQAADYAEITVQTTASIYDDAEVIPVSFYVINNKAAAYDASVTVAGDAVDTATYTVTLPAEVDVGRYVTLNVPVADDYTLQSTETLAVSIADSADIDTETGGDVAVTVNPAQRTEIADGLVTDFNIEDDEINYREPINFEIEIETTEVPGTTDDYYKYESVDIKVRICELDGDSLADANPTTDDCVGDIAKIDDIRLGISSDEAKYTFDQDDFSRILSLSKDDADEGNYYLVVEVYGREDVEDSRWGLLDREIGDEILDLEAAEHDVSILRADIDQQDNVLYFAVEVENNGRSDEDVRALVEIPALGLSQMSNTVTVYEDDVVVIYVPVMLPSVTTGNYDVRITATGEETTVTRVFEDVAITGAAAVAPDTPRLIIGVDQLNKQISEQGAVYIMTFTNNGNTARTLSIETAGANWAQTSVNPTTVFVSPQSSEVVSVFVAPREDVQGLQQFTVFVKEDNQIIKSLGMTAQITGSAVDGGLYEDLINSGLKWIAAILIVVLIVLFVAWSWRREETKAEVY